MRGRLMACAATAALMLGAANPAGAVVFDFSPDEVSAFTGASTGDGIFGVTEISLGGIVFSVSASGGAGVASLYRPDDNNDGIADAEGDTNDNDFDLAFFGIDTDPMIVTGTEDSTPISPDTGFDDNSLIVQNDATGTTINDEPQGGSLTFTLTSAAKILLERLSFIDDVEATTSDGMVIGDIIIDGPGVGGSPCGGGSVDGDGCVAGLLFSNVMLATGDSFTVSFNQSGGVIGFEAAVIPLPAGLPLMLTALGGLAWLRWRRPAA